MRQRSENRRELLKTALEIAITDFQFANGEKKFGEEGHIPMSTFVYYHWRYLYMVDKINSSVLRKKLLPEKELDMILSDMKILFKKYKESGLPFYQGMVDVTNKEKYSKLKLPKK